jgi:hypothetical protein
LVEKIFVRPNTFNNRVILIDGLGRSGKNLISVFLSSFKGVEKMRLDSQLDYLPRYFAAGKMSFDAAAVGVLTELDEKFFYAAIGRDLNLRFSDYSSAWKQGNPSRFLKRLVKPETKAIEDIRKSPPIFQDMTHDGMQFADFWFSVLGERLDFVHVLRDPLQNVLEQVKRDFGNRIGTDPREFQLSLSKGDRVYPLMVDGVEELYWKANSTERVILEVKNMFDKNTASFRKLPAHLKSKFHFVEFEKFVVEPDPYITNFEKLVGSKLNHEGKRILRRERVPRPALASKRDSAFEELSKDISAEFQTYLAELAREYDNFVSELDLPL